MILEDEASRNIKDLLDRVDKVAENQAIMMPIVCNRSKHAEKIPGT